MEKYRETDGPTKYLREREIATNFLTECWNKTNREWAMMLRADI